MADGLRIALTTTLNERLVAPLRRSLSEVERNLRGTGDKLRGVASAARDASATLAGMRGPDRAAREISLLARNTENAVSLAQRLQMVWTRTGSVMRGLGAGIAAAQAARYVLSEPFRTERTYGRALANAANVAFADRDLAGRQAGMQELDSIVVQAMRKGGGKRELILGAMNDMLASGTVSVDQVRNVLPVTAQYATAGDADIQALSSIVIRALQNGFKEADIPRVLDMALAAGQAGGFELRDMAKWLPQMLAAGRQLGMADNAGYARILASAQGSIITAGSRDEAGNNLVNLLLKINSADTQRDAKALGIDLPGSLAAARDKGVNPLDAFVNLADQIAVRDPRLTRLRAQAAGATNDADRKASYEAQAQILQGASIGKIIQDRQALMALISEIGNRDYIREVQRTILQARGQFGAENLSLIQSTPAFKIEQQENERLIAQTAALSDVNKALGTLAETSTDLYQRYPGFAGALEGAKLAVWSLAAASGGAASALALLGLAKGGAAVAGAAAGGSVASSVIRPLGSHLTGTLPAAAPAAAAAAGSFALPIAATAGAAALVAAPALAVGALIQHQMTGTEAGLRSRIATRSDRLADLDRIIGLETEGGARPDAIKRLESERDALQKDRDALVSKLEALTRAIQAQAERPIEVHLDGQQIQTSVNDRNGRDARRE